MTETCDKRSPSVELDPHAQGRLDTHGWFFCLARAKHLFNHRNRPAWGVLAVCLLLTFIAGHGLRVQTVKNAEQQFELHVRDVVGSIEERLRQHEQLLLGGVGLFDSSDSVSRTEWRIYVARLALGEHYPGIQGMGYSQIVRPAELPTHLAAIRAEGFPQYTVRTAGERLIYSPTIYLEPFSGRNLAAFGFDLMSEATRAQAMRLAAESGKTIITGKVKLVQETQGKAQAGFLMVLPVYRKYQALSTPAERWKAVRGFVYSACRVDDLMHGILGERVHALDFLIYDGEGENEATRIYASTDIQPAVPRATPPLLSTLRSIHAYGHEWTVRLQSRRDFEVDMQSPLDMAVPILGVGISVLLFVLMSFLISRRERAEELAGRMTEEIRRNEVSLRLNEARIQAILDGADYSIISTDTNGTILTFNRAAEKMLGYRADELVGKATPALFHDANEILHHAQALTAAGIPVEPDFEVFVALARRGQADTHEWTYIRKDGCRFPVLLTVTALHDGSGAVTGFLGMARDISEQRKIEQALRESSDSLMRAQQIAHIGNWDWNVETGGVRWSDEIYRIFGQQPQQFGASYEAFLRMIHPDDLARVEQAMNMALSERMPYSIDHRIILPGGGERVVHEQGEAIFDESGKSVRLLVTVQDITVRKRIEEDLVRATRQTELILEAVEEGIFGVDLAGNITFVNPSAARFLGYASVELHGCNSHAAMHHSRVDGSPYPPEDCAIYKSLIDGTVRHVNSEVFWRKDGSSFPVDYVAAPMREGEKIVGAVVTFRDITESQKVERMKSEFISTVSHELRTPLTSIRGSLGLIAGGVAGELPPQAKALVDIAHKNSERLITLVNDILDIEKIESGKMRFDMKPLELASLIEQALEVNRAYGDQFDVAFKLEQPPYAVTVNADAGRLMQVMANLLSNAAKFSPVGGTVNVSIQCSEQNVRLSVADHGLGIPEEFRGKIFQKFSQADSSDTRKKGGTGLGLNITKAIVEQMGGRIGFESEVAVGTTFFIDLPEWQEQLGSGPQDVVNNPNRILICEDDRDTARLLQMMLKQGGFDSDIAYSAEEAQDFLSRMKYRAITLDIMLHGQDGISLLHDLHANEATRDIPIIVVSAKAGRHGHDLESGSVVLDWLDKPIDEPRLMSALRRLARQGGNTPVILHVEDDTDIRQVLASLVGNEAEFVAAPTLAEAKAKLEAERFDLIILDLELPDGSGLDLLPFLNEKGLAIPVMIFSAEESSGEISRQVAAALVKARTSNEVLLATIKQLIGRTLKYDGKINSDNVCGG